MTRMSFGLFASAIFVVAAVGCGSSDDSSKSKDDSKTASAQDNPSTSKAELVGVWLGVGYLDEDLLNEKLATIENEDERQQIIAVANSFRSTRLGVSFNDDKSYEMEMEIVAVDGTARRGGTEGKWKILEQTGDTVVIEQQDALNEDVKSTQYRFVDGDHFAFVPPVAEVLQDCSPLIIFERQVGVNADAEAPSTATGGNMTNETIR